MESWDLGVVLQVEHDVMGQALCPQPVVYIDPGAVAALSGQQDLIRRVVVGGIQLIVAVCSVRSAVPTTIPFSSTQNTIAYTGYTILSIHTYMHVQVWTLTMKGHAVHVIVNIPAKNRLCPIFQVVLVVVVGQDEHLGVVGIERGTEKSIYEIPLSRRIECAGLPRGGELRLVLRGDGPHGDTFMLVRGDELGDV